MIIRHINRIKRLTPRSRSAWCNCDQNKVHDGEKCSVCGKKVGNRFKLNKRNSEKFDLN